MLSDTTTILFAAVILILPWSLKQASLFDKVKMWYKVLLSSLLIELLSVIFKISSISSIVGQEISAQITAGVEIVSMVLFIIGVLGIVKNLLVE